MRASHGGNKAQRQAWDNTMREEVGMTNIPGQTPVKRHKTRAMIERHTAKRQNVHGGVNELEFKRIARLERLELTNAWDPLERALDSNQDDQGSSGDERGKRRKSEKRTVAKKQIFLADVLLAEGPNDFVRAQARKSSRPCSERVCDVTGKLAHYRDPLTGLYVHDRRALMMLREQVPAWMKDTAISPYWDVIKTIVADST